MSTTVIVFVPGTTASELCDSSGVVWPTLLNTDLLKSEPIRYATMVTEFEANARLPVGDIVSSIALAGNKTMPVYGSLLTYLTTASTFSDGTPFTTFTYNTANLNAPIPQTSRLFYMVPYDWRRSNDNKSISTGYPNSAAWLSAALNKLHVTYSKYDPNYNLYIVAHSMGGLVSRFVLEAQTASQNPWLGNARGLITLSTPHVGAPLALAAILGEQLMPEEPAAAVGFIQTTVNNPMFPSTYELLPPPGQDFIQDGTSNYGPSDASPDLVAQLVLNGFKYTDWDLAKIFFNQLTPSAGKMPVNYYCYYGTSLPTVTSFTYDKGFSPVSTAAGDGIVPQTSSSFSIATASNLTRVPFANYTHGQMGGSDMVNYPNAINAALTLAGIPIVAATKKS